jgi:hypothetical protein
MLRGALEHLFDLMQRHPLLKRLALTILSLIPPLKWKLIYLATTGPQTADTPKSPAGPIPLSPRGRQVLADLDAGGDAEMDRR